MYVYGTEDNRDLQRVDRRQRQMFIRGRGPMATALKKKKKYIAVDDGLLALLQYYVRIQSPESK